MKKKLIDTILFFLGLTSVLAVLWNISLVAAPESLQYRIRLNCLVERADEIEALSLGNSHSRAIDFEGLGLDGYSIYQPGSDLYEVRYQLEDVVPRLTKLETVFIPISYFSYRVDNAATEIGNKKAIRRILYAAHSSNYFIRGDLKNFITGKLSPLIRSDHWEGVFKAIKNRTFPGDYRNNACGLAKKHKIDRYGKPHTSGASRRMEDEPDEAAVTEVRIDFLNEMYKTNPDVSSENSENIIKINEFLLSRGVRAVFYTPPYHGSFTEGFDRAITTEMREITRRLAADKRIEYYDFSLDEDFTDNPDFFKNPDHLNEKGAKAFSAKLRTVLSIEK